MKPRVLIRFDDICPTMDYEQFGKALKIFDKYNIKPLLGVIPECKDPELQIDRPREDFWEWLKTLEAKGYKLAMHGQYHLYDIEQRGIVNSGTHSEFAGHPYDVQLKKIIVGKKILESHGIKTDTFFAPAHSYDENTIRALGKAGFKYMSDGFTKKPVVRYGVTCIPCRSFGIPRIIFNGYYTAVFHAHEWKSYKPQSYKKFKMFCGKYHKNIVSFDEYAKQPTGNIYTENIKEKINVFISRYIVPKLSVIKRLAVDRIKRKVR